jgi:hypothetical protein
MMAPWSGGWRCGPDVVQALCNFTASPLLPGWAWVLRHWSVETIRDQLSGGPADRPPAPTPAADAHALDQDQRRAATADVVGQGHRAVAGKAGRAHTDRAQEAQPDSRTLPQLAAKLAECHL